MRNVIASELIGAFSRSTRPSATAGCYYRRPFQNAQIFRQRSRTQPFSVTARRDVLKPYLLADIGEGITECQIIQWFVQPGARVEQFDKICEVQSDKASVEITSRFDGVIKKLYYEADDMAKVGKPLVDIDIQSDISPEDEKVTGGLGESSQETPGKNESTSQSERIDTPPTTARSSESIRATEERKPPSRRHPSLATPAVRHLTKELNIDIADIPGTGKDGRVLKEDVHRYASTQSAQPTSEPQAQPLPRAQPLAEDQSITLTPIQAQMFKTMTRSLSIPHFLYTTHVDFTRLTSLRKRISSNRPEQKLSALPFIIKALSSALVQYPQINTHVISDPNPNGNGAGNGNGNGKPTVTRRAAHNIGVAIDTPSGLVVPVIHSAQSLSISEIAAEVTRLSILARQNKLPPYAFADATITVSNIGSVAAGAAVAPVIVPPQTAILGVGRSRVVPAFGDNGELVRREECVFSWSADHRVLDGAIVARCAEVVRGLLEDVEGMVVDLR